MSSNSTEEHEHTVHLLINKNNEDYIGTYDNEVNDIVPRLKRLCIQENEEMYLLTDDINMPSSSMNTVLSSIRSSGGDSISGSTKNVSPIFFGDISDTIWTNKVTKAADGSNISPFETISDQSLEITQIASVEEIHIHQTDAKKKHLLDKIKNTGIENVCVGNPIDLTPEHGLNINSSVVSENKTELQSLLLTPEKIKIVDSETSEIIENSNSSLTDTSVNISVEKALVPSTDEMIIDLILDHDPSRLSYSADVSSDDQSNRNIGSMLHLTPGTPEIRVVNAATLDKSSRKSVISSSPVSGMSKNRQRRFGTYQAPSKIIDASKKNYSSDEDLVYSSVTGRGIPMNVRRKSKKATKLSSRLKALSSPDEKLEKKKPSPCKRKKTSSENTSETTGKFRKRSISEHIKTNEKNHLINRSRSLSPVSTNICTTSIASLSAENSVTKTRKRINSDSHNESQAKFR